MLVLADVVLLFALFVSANLALAWAEMASFPLHADKSSLAGLGAVVMFFPLRWVMLAIALWIGAIRGGLAGLPGGPRAHVLLALSIHLALGVVSYRAFNWVVRAVQEDNPGPQRAAWIFGLVLPMLTFAVAFWTLHRKWIPRHPLLTALALALLVWAHWGGWGAGYQKRSVATESRKQADG